MDRALLDALQRDGRISWAELGRRVGLTPPAVADRVARLERNGVITDFRATVDPARVGRPVLAFLRIRVGGDRRLERARVLVERLPAILECHRVTGEDCFVLKAAVADTAELEALVDQLSTIGDPITSIVLSTLVTPRAVDPAHPARTGHGPRIVPVRAPDPA